MFINENNYTEKERKYVKRLNQNYEYCYLESMHYLCEKQEVKNIITGLSYGINGFESDMFTMNTVNFSMHSQDLYYDIQHIIKQISVPNNRLKNCVMTLGYYSFFYDLSRTKSNYKIATTYYPLFNNTHHVLIENYDIEELKDEEFIDFYHAFFEKNKCFYGSAISRENTNPTITNLGGWCNVSEEERLKEAKELCLKHNKHINHTDTLSENVILWNKMCKILSMAGINIYVVVMPFSEQYLEFIDSRYMEIMMQILEDSPYQINYINFNEGNIFTVEDFLDCDHLNYDGAVKATQLIDKLLQ